MINVSVTPLQLLKIEVCWDSISNYSFVRFKYRVDSIGSTYYNIGGSGVFSPFYVAKNGLDSNTSYRLIYRTWCNSMVERIDLQLGMVQYFSQHHHQ